MNLQSDVYVVKAKKLVHLDLEYSILSQKYHISRKKGYFCNVVYIGGNLSFTKTNYLLCKMRIYTAS